MPELPEVETVRRGLVPVLVGRCLLRVTVRRGDLRRPVPDGFAERLRGRRVDALTRRAKYLLWHLDDGAVVIGHLGMSGRLRVFEAAPPPPEPHDHLDFETDAGATIRFTDSRRFGLFDLAADATALAGHPRLARLGPEPLAPGFDGPALAARLAGRRGPLKTVLLDQAVVAGLGNIYVCEALFRAGLAPDRAADSVDGARADRLAAAIRAVLDDAVAAGGSSLRDHRTVSGELGYFQHAFAVYGRAGQPCPGCDGAQSIRRLVQGGRSTFYCARCQR